MHWTWSATCPGQATAVILWSFHSLSMPLPKKATQHPPLWHDRNCHSSAKAPWRERMIKPRGAVFHRHLRSQSLPWSPVWVAAAALESSLRCSHQAFDFPISCLGEQILLYLDLHSTDSDDLNQAKIRTCKKLDYQKQAKLSSCDIGTLGHLLAF